jgi:hypothetical protein
LSAALRSAPCVDTGTSEFAPPFCDRATWADANYIHIRDPYGNQLNFTFSETGSELNCGP